MELTLTQSNFTSLTNNEMFYVEGGKDYTATQVAAIGVGIVAVSWAPVAYCVPGCGVALGTACLLGGVGLIGKGTGCY